jgi:hypothetical protein
MRHWRLNFYILFVVQLLSIAGFRLVYPHFAALCQEELGIAALMNLWTQASDQGAANGLENRVNASAHIFSPMIGAAIAVWLGYQRDSRVYVR